MILRRFLYRHYRALAGAALLSCASAGCTVALLSHINRLASQGVLGQSLRPLLVGVGWLLALLATSACAQLMLARLGGNLVAQLRMELSKRFIELEYEKLAERRHTVFGSLIDDVANIAPLALVAPLLAYNVLLAVLYAGYLATVSLPLLGMLAVFLGATFAVSLALARAMRGKLDELRRANEKVFEYFRFISDGKKEMTLNAARAAHFTGELMTPAILRARGLMVRAYTGLGLNEAWSMAVMYGAIFLIVYLGYALLGLTQDTIVHFVIGAVFLGGPVGFIVSAGRQVAVGTASLRHLERMGLDTATERPESAPRAAGAHAQEGWSQIRLEGVCYSYPGSTGAKPTIGPIDLTVARGEMLFIVGGNGSGKSTLLLLLSSLVAPHEGRMAIDGTPVDADLRWYRERFTGVFGDFFLFPHVLDAEGQPLSDARIGQLLDVLDLGEQVQTHEGELSRLALSTGQRKRLALLQCYAEDRDIFFFDEWAADQDIHFRDYFYRSLLPALKANGKTVIAISHDDRYFSMADRVITLEAGAVVSDVRQVSQGASGLSSAGKVVPREIPSVTSG
ncbi:cyclic peptide export ABC transporter [Dyella sp. BiH032]|uniref:cyclic peptide export ABC transporter n=1 Tax=Dyella sp. BiH032 TaxID=3075430 RepID=UPI002892C564|nr:cyclic peptide export ABC transporter [Dyella sp. BiH032]WNL45747.1 cyclic peptide export ABC transporter [Dyella sp. BiH032]